jgi:hypothetical protein
MQTGPSTFSVTVFRLPLLSFSVTVFVDYLIGQSDHMIIDKNLVRRMEDIEALPNEEKDKVYYFIDMALAYNKTKKAFAH